MQRGFLVGVACGTIVAAGLAGCAAGKHNSSTSSSSSPASTASSPSADAAGTDDAPPLRVAIDGRDQNPGSEVLCSTSGNNVYIRIGGADSPITAVLTRSNPPEVGAVSLGNVDGAKLTYNYWLNRGDARATRSGNSFKITGIATSADTSSDPANPIHKPFEIDATCPLPLS